MPVQTRRGYPLSHGSSAVTNNRVVGSLVCGNLTHSHKCGSAAQRSCLERDRSARNLVFVLDVMTPLTRPGLLTILLSARFALPLFAQAETTIPETETAQHVGQHVTVDEREKG